MESVQHGATDRTEDPEVSYMFFNFVSGLRICRTVLTERIGKSPPTIPGLMEFAGGEVDCGEHRKPSAQKTTYGLDPTQLQVLPA